MSKISNKRLAEINSITDEEIDTSEIPEAGESFFKKATLIEKPNSVEVYVEDAVGDKYCHSCGDIQFKKQAIRHARWYASQRKHTDFDGKPLSICRPLRIVIIEYFDPSVKR